MKSFQRFLATGLIVVVPTGMFASANFRDLRDVSETSSYETSHNHTAKADIFIGNLQKKPKSGHVGVWTVSDKELHVNENTLIKNLNGGLRANDKLSIATKNIDGKIFALEIIKV